MINPVSIFRGGYFIADSLSCGLAATLLNGRIMGHWTWMAHEMTFTKGMQVGMGFSLITLLADAIIRRAFVAINASSWLKGPNKDLAKSCIMLLSLSSQLVFFYLSGLPALSCLTFWAVSETVLWGLTPNPPFYWPPDWTKVMEGPEGLEWMFELYERVVFKAWIALTKEPWTKSLGEFQNDLLNRDHNNGRTSRVLRDVTIGNDKGVLMEVTQPHFEQTALYHSLAVVKNGFGFTLNVGSVCRAEFDQYAELFDRVLNSLRLGADWVSITEEKIKSCVHWMNGLTQKREPLRV